MHRRNAKHDCRDALSGYGALCIWSFSNSPCIQLLEPYTGKLSEEVDDVDDDGPRISLRWLYTPDELPRHHFRARMCSHQLCSRPRQRLILTLTPRRHHNHACAVC
jgi:hypothetical protein